MSLLNMICGRGVVSAALGLTADVDGTFWLVSEDVLDLLVLLLLTKCDSSFLETTKSANFH